ncbi:uncharacterized protein [Triticum aestivum]|uniref:uncharacterized protein n=1 Tax=Triticum aestivum TaxID=4565 RepID=UPI001D024CD6|nr:uncharacterized protein LOC123109579 [Triticum aestivum]
MAPIHVSSSEVILLDDSDDEELLVMNIADVTSLDDLDFSNDGPGNKKTCAVDNTSSQDAAVDVDNYSTKSNGLAFLDHDGHRCEKADDVVVISSSGDEESAADNGATDSNSGKSFVSVDSNSISKKKRGPRPQYNYWHFNDECQIIDADGMLRRKKKYKGGDVPVPALIQKLKKGPSPIIYRGELSVSRVRGKRRHLMNKFREAVKMGDNYKPLNMRDQDLYDRSIAAWPHIIEEEASTMHDHE